jgi:flavin reductase (DIM6/NTAB) family NADH-FMN oxidoreductase RutF
MTIQDNFKKAMRSYVYSVSIMSNIDDNKNLNAITVSSVTSVSIDPPSLLVCINKTAGIHDSIVKDSKFCINLLKKSQQDMSNLCSTFQEEENRFKNDQWDTKGIPFLKNAQANIFCKVDEIISYHTHSIVVAKVTESKYSNEIDTLIYVDGSYE